MGGRSETRYGMTGFAGRGGSSAGMAELFVTVDIFFPGIVTLWYYCIGDVGNLKMSMDVWWGE